jgi:tetratricopeptide (TPR) repeat protein
MQAREAHREGAEKFRQGQYALARVRFDDARKLFALERGEEAPETLEALSDAGAAAAALGDHDAARAAHQSVLAARRRLLGDAHASVGTSLHNLGTVLRAQGDLAGAEACHSESLLIWQAALGDTHAVLAKSLSALFAIAEARGDASAALHYAGHSLSVHRRNFPETDPRMAVAFDDLARAHSLAGDDPSAIAAWRSALDVLQRHFGADTPRAAPVLTNLGVASRSLGDVRAARDWFAAAVEAAPGLPIARHHLAACLARLGQGAAAKGQRMLALSQQSVFVQKATRMARARVLIPSVSDDGNVPLEHLLPGGDFTRIWWFIGDGRPPALPPFDCIFNGIGDPDMAGAAGSALEAFLCERKVPVFNRPDRIARTRRDLLPGTLASIEGLLMPAIHQLAGDEGLGPAVMAPPFLLRPAGSHGGAGLRLVEGWDGFDPSYLSTAPAWYVSAFVDFRSPDGFYRKYRMAFVDRRPFPYHLAISPGWLVHYFSADMQAHEWKLAEEAAFLADPRAALGGLAYDAIVAIGRTLDLDFCGIDFAVLPDGRILVFEANATMLIHPEKATGPLAIKNIVAQQIIDAMGQLMISAGRTS